MSPDCITRGYNLPRMSLFLNSCHLLICICILISIQCWHVQIMTEKAIFEHRTYDTENIIWEFCLGEDVFFCEQGKYIYILFPKLKLYFQFLQNKGTKKCVHISISRNLFTISRNWQTLIEKKNKRT